jgi:hypothetical protein
MGAWALFWLGRPIADELASPGFGLSGMPTLRLSLIAVVYAAVLGVPVYRCITFYVRSEPSSAKSKVAVLYLVACCVCYSIALYLIALISLWIFTG